jgi:hypothetical protein
MDPRIETCRRWLAYHARRAVSGIFKPDPAPRERLMRRERLLEVALAEASTPHLAHEIRTGR